MRLEITPRAPSGWRGGVASIALAVFVTVVVGALMFAALGKPPAAALYVYFIEPLLDPWSLHELAVKATPLILIAAGLTVCFRSNNWNIGAEGQFVLGAIGAAAIPVLAPQATGPLLLPSMLVLAVVSGALWAAIPAALKNRFGTNEILVSLMLVYIAGHLLDWLVRGPWRDPDGFNFPQSRAFGADAMLPEIVSSGDWGGRANWGSVIAIIAALATWWLMKRTLKGFELTISGASPRAAGFAGFHAKRTAMFAFLFSGALAGLAGGIEIAGSLGQLRPSVSPGYGFTAIIVAFLARLNPAGTIVAGLVLALTYIGGEAAQLSLGVSERIARVFQGVLLFSVLAADALTRYRVRLAGTRRAISTAPVR